jgi:transposase-like protein
MKHPISVSTKPAAGQFDVHPNQITQWRSQLLKGAAGVFGSEAKSESNAPTIDVKTLHASYKLRLRRDRGAGAGE